MRRLAAVLKLAPVLCLLLLLWLGYGYIFSASVPSREVRRGAPEEERRCLYRQGLDPAAYGRLAAENDTYSQFFCGAGAYPAGLCTVHLAYLNHGERMFIARTKELYESRMNNELSSRLWPVAATSHGWPRCTQYFDEAFVFGVGTSVADELYFQLHVNTLLPLYSLLALRKHLGPPPVPGYSVVLLPAMEDYSLKTVDWHTDAFSEAHKFDHLQQMVESFAGGTTILPLVLDSLTPGEMMCLRVVHFGVGTVDCSDVVLQEGFSRFMQGRLGLPVPPPRPTEPYVCLAKRSKNRRILNEDGLVAALSKLVKVQVLQFDALSYREQVSQMQQFTILAGFHGGELINGLYMPPDSVSIQLVPYDAQSLDTEKYARILRPRGPYLEWRNTHEQNSRPNQVEDRDNSLADSVVHVEEFVGVVKQALKLGINSRLVQLQGPPEN